MPIILFLPSIFTYEHFVWVFISFCGFVLSEILPILLTFLIEKLVKLIKTTSKKDQKLSLKFILSELKRVILDFDFSEFILEFVVGKIVETIVAGTNLFPSWNLPVVLPL